MFEGEEKEKERRRGQKGKRKGRKEGRMEQNRKEEEEEEEELPPRDIPGCPAVRTLLSLPRAQGQLLVTK